MSILDNIKLNKIEDIALKASRVVMQIYKDGFDVEYKDDNSPLTKADLKANDIICTSLEKLYPNIPILSEENQQIDYEERKDWEYYWCIDPIDGTKEFVKKNGEFTINIALIHKNTPILGVVFAPVINKLYSAKKESGAYLKIVDNNNSLIIKESRLPLTKNSNDSFVVVASKSNLSQETKDFITNLSIFYPKLTTNSIGSSLKFCMVAEASANIYPRVAPTKEWDSAAADAIVREAGGMVYQYDSSLSPIDYIKKDKRLKPVIYNKQNLYNPNFVVVGSLEC